MLLRKSSVSTELSRRGRSVFLTSSSCAAAPTTCDNASFSSPSLGMCCHRPQTSGHAVYAQQRRCYDIMSHSNDIHSTTLMEVLGLKGESELEQLQRSPQMMRALFRKRAKMLRPDTVPADAERMRVLVGAYTFLKSEQNKINYLNQGQSSIDHRLGIIREGDNVFGNYDPEHQSLDHLLMQGEAASGFESAEALGTQRMFSDFTRVHKDTFGFEARTVGDDKELPTAAPPKPGEKLRPQRGKNVAFLLRLSFEEGTHGCQKEISYERQKLCIMCRGSGRAGVVHTKCPQCHGRGALKIKSGSYDVGEMCDYCMGHGKVPPRLCSCCKGQCVLPATETYVVSVPSASANMTELWVQRKGHDGKRGGVAGNLIVTLLVGEHRVFHTNGLDLHAALPVPLSVALLGGYVQVPTLNGRQSLRIAPMTNSGDVVVLQGQGIVDHLGEKKRNNNSKEASGDEEAADESSDVSSSSSASSSSSPLRGDIRYHIVVVIPSADRLSSRQMAAMEVLKAIEEKEAAKEEEKEAQQKRAQSTSEGDDKTTSFGAATTSAEKDQENATRRPRTFEAEEVSSSSSSMEGLEREKTLFRGELPSLRRAPIVPRQPVAAVEATDDHSNPNEANPTANHPANKLRASAFFAPQQSDASSCVVAPSMEAFSEMKRRYTAWLPNSTDQEEFLKN